MSDALIRVSEITLSAAGQAVSLAGFGVAGVAAVQIAGAFGGTVTFEGTVDGTTYELMAATPLVGGTPVSTATGPGIWTIPTLGVQQVRARCTTYTSGTPKLVARWTPA